MSALITWFRKLGLEFVVNIVESNNEPALKRLIELSSTLSAMRSG